MFEKATSHLIGSIEPVADAVSPTRKITSLCGLLTMTWSFQGFSTPPIPLTYTFLFWDGPIDFITDSSKIDCDECTLLNLQRLAERG
jgi:hypothetical protein